VEKGHRDAMAPEAENFNDRPTVTVDDDGIAHYRASGLGGCDVALILLRSGFGAMAPPEAMQKRFNEGHLHEPDIVRRANTEFGLEVFAKDPATDKQWRVSVPVTATVVIDGSTDGTCVGMLPDEPDYWNERSDEFEHGDEMTLAPGERRVFEAKTMSSAAFKKWRAMTWPQRWAEYPGYAKQLTIYLRGMSILTGEPCNKWVYAVKDKESGEILIEPGIGEPYPWASIVAQLMGVEAHVRNGLPIPESCYPKRSYPCPVFYAGPCGDDERNSLDGREAEVVAELGITLKRAQAREAEAKQAYVTARDEIKKHLPEGGKFDAADGWKVAFSKKEKTGTTTVETFDMERFVLEHPDLAEEYTTTEEKDKWSQERLTVTPPKGWTP
jgi:hypothetical protein